jgi:hypothetical protein
MVGEGERNSLTAILEGLAPETPFFVPDEILILWFPPWLKAGDPDPVCLTSAQEAAALFGCSFFPMTPIGNFGALRRRQIQIRTLRKIQRAPLPISAPRS